jgi:hypothetical protein
MRRRRRRRREGRRKAAGDAAAATSITFFVCNMVVAHHMARPTLDAAEGRQPGEESSLRQECKVCVTCEVRMRGMMMHEMHRRLEAFFALFAPSGAKLVV